MSKKILIDAFYTQFNAFLKELANSYPEDADFPVFIETLNLVKFANPMMVVNYVKTEIVIPYKEKITNRDESFFLNFDYNKTEDVDLNIVDKLKTYISTMTDESKNTVWDYINLISRLVLKIDEL
jgi:hypothetical protein